MNRKQLAVEVCKREGLKVNLTVAQVAEVLKHALAVLNGLSEADRVTLIKPRRPRKSVGKLNRPWP